MSILSTISEALHLYGKAINRNVLTSVTFEFKSSPVEVLPSNPIWEVTIKLSGDRYTGDLSILSQESSAEDVSEAPKVFENVFSQEFKGAASSEELALKVAYEEIKVRVASFLRAREEETAFAQQAMLTVTSDDQVELSALWASSEAPVEGQVEAP
jgi:hypothetical protein